MAAVRAFCSTRGQDLAVLELTGFPLFRLDMPLVIKSRASSRSSPAVRHEVVAKQRHRDLLLHHLRALRCEDPRCVFVVRGSQDFSIGAQQLLGWHFQAYGEVQRVLMADPGPSSLEKRIRRLTEGRFSEDCKIFRYSDGESKWDPRLGARGWWPIMFFNGEEWRPDDLAFYLEKCLSDAPRSRKRQTRSGNLAFVVMETPADVLAILERGTSCCFEGMQLELSIFEPWLLTEDDYCSGVVKSEGSEVSFRLRPLAQSLANLPALQRLHLEGCGLQDTGLATLLPHLANGLPKLSRLSLARNGLKDIRLISHFLEGRRAMQLRGQAVPLGLLDLSANPNLGASSNPMTSTPFCRTWERLGRPSSTNPARHSAIGSKPRRRRQTCDRRISLLRVVCEALRQGLLIKTLRLRSMQFILHDVRPLLDLLWHLSTERSRTIRSCFPLIEVSLEGNPLEPQVVGTITKRLKQLEHSADMAGGTTSMDIPRSGGHVLTSELQRDLRRLPGSALSCPGKRLSTRSLPCASACRREPCSDDGDDPDCLEDIRRAVSEADADSEPEVGERADIQRRFRDDLVALDRLAQTASGSPLPVQAMDQPTRVSTAPQSTTSGGFSIPVRHVPDMSSELGFVPHGRVHPELRGSESDPGSEERTPVSSARGPHSYAEIVGRGHPAAFPEVQHYDIHEPLEYLRRRFDHDREAPPDRVAHVLRQSLDAMRSDDSSNTIENVENCGRDPEEHLYQENDESF